MPAGKRKYRAEFDFHFFYFYASNLKEAENIAKGHIMNKMFLEPGYPVTRCFVHPYKGEILKSLEEQIDAAILEREGRCN